MPPDVRPFSKPWKIVERDESFEVQDSASRTLAFVYFTDDPNRRNFMRRLSKDDARRKLRSEEHTSELQSPDHLVCRLLLEKKKKRQQRTQQAQKREGILRIPAYHIR